MGYFGSVGDLFKRVIERWVLVVMGFLFAVGWLFDTFVRPNWTEAPPVIDAIAPYSGWLLLVTVLFAVTLAYHQMRTEKAAGPTETHNYYGPTYNFPPGPEGLELYRNLAQIETVRSNHEITTDPRPPALIGQDTDEEIGP